jgi:uncharacterized protein
MCVGCREKAPQEALIRFVNAGGRVTHDPDRRLPGRGAWLHPSPECWALAVQRNAFARAFRAKVEGIDSNGISWQRSASTN